MAGPPDPSDFPAGAFGQDATFTGDPGGLSLQDHSQPGIWVRVTGAPVSGRHPFVQVARKASGDGWDALPAGPGAAFGTTAAGGGPLRTADGSTLDTDAITYAVSDPAHPDGPGWLAVGGVAGTGTASDWIPGQVLSGTNSSGYVVRRRIMTSVNVFADYSPTTDVTAYRWESNPGVPLPNIPAGQTVLYRASPDAAGAYECTPWGGQITVNPTSTWPQVSGGTVTGSVQCVNGVPTFTGTVTLSFTDYLLSLSLTGRDLAGASLSRTLVPPPPPPPPPAVPPAGFTGEGPTGLPGPLALMTGIGDQPLYAVLFAVSPPPSPPAVPPATAYTPAALPFLAAPAAPPLLDRMAAPGVSSDGGGVVPGDTGEEPPGGGD